MAHQHEKHSGTKWNLHSRIQFRDILNRKQHRALISSTPFNLNSIYFKCNTYNWMVAYTSELAYKAVIAEQNSIGEILYYNIYNWYQWKCKNVNYSANRMHVEKRPQNWKESSGDITLSLFIYSYASPIRVAPPISSHEYSNASKFNPKSYDFRYIF